MRNPLAVCGQLSPTTTVGHPHYAEAPLVQTGVAVCSADPCMANCRFALWSDVIYAETEVWVRTGRPVDDDARARHVEIAAFARSVEGDEVAFESCSRRRLLDTSLSAPDGTVRTHAQTVIERCSP